MFKQKMVASATIGVAFLMLCPQVTLAEGYTSAKLLAENAEAQESFINISIMMAGAVATQAKPDIARCLNDWYFKTEADQPKRISEIQSAMRQYPNYHPSAVLLGVMQKVCGSFKP